jgi:hypothetical protein
MSTSNTNIQHPLWKRVLAYLNIIAFLGQMCLPARSYANQHLSDESIEVTVNQNSQTSRSYNSDHQFVKQKTLDDSVFNETQSIESFHKKLLDFKKSALAAPQMLPIINADITIIIPHYPLAKRLGDRFVQARLIRTQIFNDLNRSLLSNAYVNETAQINALYNNAYDFADSYGVKFGESVSRDIVNKFNRNFVWPELRTINGEKVLVPVVHLTDAALSELTVKGHQVEFGGKQAEFRSITIQGGTLTTLRNTYLHTAQHLTINEGGTLLAKGDLNLLVGGTLQNLSGRLSAADNINIIAGQYLQKTMVHRYATQFEQGTRLGQIASVDAGGDISLRTYQDIAVVGGTMQGNTIRLRADGNILLQSQQTTTAGQTTLNGFTSNTSTVEHLVSKLTAKDSVFLMASGAIEINASTIHADSGVIQLLAQQGVYIGNEMNQFQQSRQGKLGKVTEQEQQLQTMAVRSALNAGKGVLIATELGDITLKATSIKAGQGTEVSARNGKLNLLLAKEQDEYFYNKVKKGTWKIKTETKQDQTDTAVYNAIVGGVKVHASRGVTLELAQKEGQSISQVMSDMAATTDLAWMNTLYNDPQFAGNIDLAYQTLQDLHLHKKTSNLSPAAMAVIAIAVAVAMGPGAGWIGTGEGAIAAKGFVNAAAMQAGAVTLATQAATGLASGKGLGGTLESMVQEDSIRSLAISMVTAGVLDHFGKTLNQDFFGTVPATEALTAQQQMISFANQAAQTLARTTVSAGISNIINGGSFKEFTASMKASLYQAGVMAIGKHMAQSVGKAYRDGDINQAVRYLSHAGAGCIIGLASKGTGGTQGSGSESCLTGSVGAVTGELVADTYKAKKLTEIFNQHKTELDALKSSNGWTQQQLEAYVLSAPMQNKINYQIQQMTAAGVDLAKLSGALSALAGGGDVNLAAMTAENAAQNNAFFLIPLAVMLLKGIDLALTANELWGIYQKMQTSEAEGNAALQQWLQEQIEGKLIEKAIPGFKTFDELLDWCRKNNVLSMQMVEQVKDHLKTKQGPDAGPPKVTVLDTKHTKLNLNNVTVETNMITGKELELTHLPSGKKVKNDGILGEQVAAQVLTEATGITFHGHIKNKSNNGPDLLAVNPDTSKKEIFLIEVKSSTEKNYPNPDKLDLVNRGEKWIRAAAKGQLNKQDLTPEAEAYAINLNKLLEQGYTIKPFMAKVGVPHEGQAGIARVTVVPAK